MFSYAPNGATSLLSHSDSMNSLRNDRFMPNVQRLSRVPPSTQVTVIPDVDHATAPGHAKFREALLAFLLKQKEATQ